MFFISFCWLSLTKYQHTLLPQCLSSGPIRATIAITIYIIFLGLVSTLGLYLYFLKKIQVPFPYSHINIIGICFLLVILFSPFCLLAIMQMLRLTPVFNKIKLQHFRLSKKNTTFFPSILPPSLFPLSFPYLLSISQMPISNFAVRSRQPSTSKRAPYTPHSFYANNAASQNKNKKNPNTQKKKNKKTPTRPRPVSRCTGPRSS